MLFDSDRRQKKAILFIQTEYCIALRKPDYFSGIHIHVNSSYDTPPAPKAKNLV